MNLNSNTRKRETINARAICYKILRDECGMSYNLIGKQFSKNHATILHACKEFKFFIMSDRQMERDYKNALSIWKDESIDYKEITPLKIKKDLKDLFEQNKTLSLSLINVQEQFENRLKEIELRLENVTSSTRR